MKLRGPNTRAGGRKIPNGLVAAGSAAVLAVYAAGYTRTRSAADQFDGEAAVRRAPVPPPRSAPSREDAVVAPPVAPSASEIAAPAKVTPDQAAKPELVASVQPKAIVVPGTHGDTPSSPPTSEPAPAAPAPAPVASVASNTAPASAPVQVATVAPPAPAPAPAAPQASPVAPPWKDGTWEGWGNCRHGDIQASVVITGGKIVSATIAQCLTRYSCDIIDLLPPQVPKRQSPDVDSVGGATQSANAFYYAVYDALRKSKLALSQ